MGDSSSDDSESYEAEDVNPVLKEAVRDAELRELQAEIDEEERLAMGGWSAETLEEFQREREIQIARRNSSGQYQRQTTANAGREVAAEFGCARVPHSDMAGADFKKAADVGSVRVLKEALNLPASASIYSPQTRTVSADMAEKGLEGVDFVVAASACPTRASAAGQNMANITSRYNMHAYLEGESGMAACLEDPAIIGPSGLVHAAADGSSVRVAVEELNLAILTSRYSRSSDLEGMDIETAHLENPMQSGPTVLPSAAGAIFACPISSISVEDAALMDLYKAQPLQAPPVAGSQIIEAQSVAGHMPNISTAQPALNMAPAPVVPPAQLTPSRPPKTHSPNRGCKPTAVTSISQPKTDSPSKPNPCPNTVSAHSHKAQKHPRHVAS